MIIEIWAEMGETIGMIGILTKTRSIREKLAVTVILCLGADTTQVEDPSTQVVLGQTYATVLLAAIIVTTTRPTNISCLGGPSTVTRCLLGPG